MIKKNFKPKHINVSPEDLMGNKGRGRYIFLPGSDGRAKEIAEHHFENLQVKKHPRQHNLYMGTLVDGDVNIDVAAIATGMGAPSIDIIFNELVRLGAKRFLRMGTCGLLQPEFMHKGDFVIATAAVRDDGATYNYVPLEYPALASIDMILAARKAAQILKISDKTHEGLLHSKGSLYAREFLEGPMAARNKAYAEMLQKAGVIATEMEASMLFTLASILDHEFGAEDNKRNDISKIKAGAVCVVLGEGEGFATGEALVKMNDDIILFAKQTIIELAKMEASKQC